jgi:hypothetical protein
MLPLTPLKRALTEEEFDVVKRHPDLGAEFRYPREWISTPAKRSRPGQSGTIGVCS